MPLRVGVDLDGVVFPDFAGSVRRYLVEREGWREADCPPATRWEFYEDWGLSTAEFVQVCDAGVDAGVIFGPDNEPEPDARRALRDIRDHNASIHVVTDRSFGRPGRAAELTLLSLAKHSIPFDVITFGRDKRAANLHYMIDDRVENYWDLNKQGVWVFLRDRPWNRGQVGPSKTVHSLTEYADKVTSGVN